MLDKNRKSMKNWLEDDAVEYDVLGDLVVNYLCWEVEEIKVELDRVIVGKLCKAEMILEKYRRKNYGKL